MKRYFITQETDTDKVGDVDGIQCYIESTEEGQHFLNYPLYQPYDREFLGCISLDTKAVITDYLSVQNKKNTGLMVSKKMVSIISKYKLFQCQIIPAKIRYQDQYLDYYWIQIYSDLTEDIDYKKTQFQVRQLSILGGDKFEPLNNVSNNREDLINYNKTIAGTRKSLAPNPVYEFIKVIDSFDVIRIGYFDMRIYFSEALRSDIQDNIFTGFNWGESKYFE